MTLERRFLAAAATTDTTTAEPQLRGYAIVFNSLSEDLGGFREKINPDAIELNDNVFAFWSHDPSQPIGSTRSGTLALNTDENGVRFDLSTERFTPLMLAAAKAGDVQMSFGFRAIDQEWSRDEAGNAIRTLKKIAVFEVSPVTTPAYADTSAAIRSMEEAFGQEVVPVIEEIVVEEEAIEEPSDNTDQLRSLEAMSMFIALKAMKGK